MLGNCLLVMETGSLGTETGEANTFPEEMNASPCCQQNQRTKQKQTKPQNLYPPLNVKVIYLHVKSCVENSEEYKDKKFLNYYSVVGPLIPSTSLGHIFYSVLFNLMLQELFQVLNVLLQRIHFIVSG